MKKLLFISLFLWANIVFAQKVTYKDGTVFKDGQAYGYIKKQGNIMMGQNFSVRSLNDKEVMFAKFIPDTDYYEVIFRESGAKGYLQGDIGFGKMLAKTLVKNNMLTPEGINPEGERYFLQENGTVPAALQGLLNMQAGVAIPPNTGTSTAGMQYQTVQRNRNAPLYVLFDVISQGTTDIAKYSSNTEAVMGGLQVTQVIKLPNGLKIAQATYFKSKNNAIQLLTLRDNQIHSLPYSQEMMEKNVLETIARYLI